MFTIAIVNLKGGVAKTTTAINMATILATEHGKRVLLVDADSQHNATGSLLPPGEYVTLADLLLYEKPGIRGIPSAIANLDVLPSDFSLATVGLPNINGGQYDKLALSKWLLSQAGSYDYCIIDCPSSFVHPGCMSAILAADEAIIPVCPDPYSLSGGKELVEQMEGLKAINPRLSIGGVLLTKYRHSSVGSAINLKNNIHPVKVYDALIRYSPKAEEAMWQGETVCSYSPRSSVARDYRLFVGLYLEQKGGANNG